MTDQRINRSTAATDHSRDQNLVTSIDMTQTLSTRQVHTDGASFMFQQQVGSCPLTEHWYGVRAGSPWSRYFELPTVVVQQALSCSCQRSSKPVALPSERSNQQGSSLHLLRSSCRRDKLDQIAALQRSLSVEQELRSD